jgi:hypothetical protein
MPLAPEHHHWSRSDDLAALYAYKFRPDLPTNFIEEIAMQRNISIGSFRMRISNYEFLDTGQGLDHFAQQTQQIYSQFHNCSEAELRTLEFPEVEA